MLFKLHYFGYQSIEKAPFEIQRPEGSVRYIFFHFSSSVFVELKGDIVEAAPGSCILFEPRYPQRFFVDKVNLNHDYLDFTISDPTFFQDIRLPRNTILSPNMSNRILEGIEQIHKESNSNRLGSEHMISSIMETLFVSISRKIHNFSFTAAEYEATLLRKFEKIRLEMYHQPGRFKVKTMAESMDFSQSHFTHLYRKFFHITPMKDLTKARVHFIQQCDLDDHTSYELTQLLGFESVEYFYRWFKAHFNTTIQQYRTSLERIPDDDDTA